MNEPTTEAGKRLVNSQVWVGVSRDLAVEVAAIEAEAVTAALDAIKFWRISGFSEGPHWDHAIVEAETEEEARDVLKSVLDDDQLEEVWRVLPMDSWRVKESVRPLLFVLGGGCR